MPKNLWMYVWTVSTLTSVEQLIDPLQTLESYGAVFFEMRNEAWEFIGERRTGEDTILKRSWAVTVNFRSLFSRHAFRDASNVIWKHVSVGSVSHGSNTHQYVYTVNVVSRAYHTRVGKERLQEGRQGGVDGLLWGFFRVESIVKLSDLCSSSLWVVDMWREKIWISILLDL